MFLESWDGVGLVQGQLGGVSNFNLFTDAPGSFEVGVWFDASWFQ